MELIPLKIEKLVSTDTGTGAFLLVLKEADKTPARILPIVIGPFEAQAIIFGLEKNIDIPPRPITHDLFYNVLHTLGYKLTKVIINKFAQGIFYARLILEKEGQMMEFDARPSDAVALAVRFQAPVYTTEEVMKKTGVEPEKLDKMDPESNRDEEFFSAFEADEEGENDVPEDINHEIDRLIRELEEVFGKQDKHIFNINLNDEDAKELAESFFKLMDKLLAHLPGGEKKKKMPDEEELKRMLDEAIANEDYERAAQLRDALKMLQQMKKSSGSGEKDKDDTGETDHTDDE